MFLITVWSLSYFEPIGLAAARTDVRALRVVIIPALAIETVCCSYQKGHIKKSSQWNSKVAHHYFVQDAPSGI